MALYELLGAFVLGALVSLGVVFYLAYRDMNRDPPASSAETHEDAMSTDNPESMPMGAVLFTCDLHGIKFRDEDEARKHAIEEHGAPRDGDTWKHTYPQGRE